MKACITNRVLNIVGVSWDVHVLSTNTYQPINSSGFSPWISTTVECARLLSFVILALFPGHNLSHS